MHIFLFGERNLLKPEGACGAGLGALWAPWEVLVGPPMALGLSGPCHPLPLALPSALVAPNFSARALPVFAPPRCTYFWYRFWFCRAP